MTIRELIEELKIFDENSTIHFEGLTFYRTKYRGNSQGVDIVQIEFNETYKVDDMSYLEDDKNDT